MRRRWSLLLVILPGTFLLGLVTLFVALQSELSAMASPGIDQRALRVSKRGPLFTHQIVQELTHLPGVVDFTAVVPDGCYVPPDSPVPGACWAVNRTYLPMFASDIPVPPDAVTRWDAQKNGALVGKRLAAAMHWREGQPIQLPTRRGGTIDLVVSYIAERGNALIVHSEYIDQLHGSTGEAAPLWLVVDEPAHRTKVIEAIEARFHGATEPVSVWTLEATKALQRRMSGVLILVLTAAGIIAAVILFFTLFGMLTLSIEERRTELATLRAIGWRPSHLARIILAEAMLLVAPGALLGALLAYLSCERVIRPSIFIELHVTPGTAALAAALGIALGGLIGIVPAARAATVDVLGALRSG